MIERGWQKVSSANFPFGAHALASVVQKLAHRRKNMLGLRKDNIFELGLVGAEGVHGSDAFDGGVELIEKLVGDARGDFRAKTPAQHVFISDDDAMIFAHGGGDGVPIVGGERAEIDDFDGDAFALELRGSDFRAMHDGAEGDDADFGTFFHQTRFAEGNGVVGAGIFGAIVRLAVEMLVLEEHDGIVATDGGAQKSGNIEGGGGHDDAKTGAVRENGFAALAVINAAAGEVAADGHTQHGGRFEIAVGAPAQDAQLVANLHHGRPDVIEELDFGDGLEAAGGHADGAANDAGFREGRVENAILAVFSLQAGGGFEDAALAFDVLQIFVAAGVGDIFAENGDALVAGHFVGERGGDHFNHGFGGAVKLRLGGECR